MSSFSFPTGKDQKVEVDVDVKSTPLPIPAYSDIAKAANDLLSKDFYHVSAANLEIKSKAPNGVAYTVKGKSAHNGAPSGSLEGKKADKASGIPRSFHITSQALSFNRPGSPLSFLIFILPPARRKHVARSDKLKPSESQSSPVVQALIAYKHAGTTGTATFSTTGNVDLKVELENNLAEGLKADILGTMKPDGPPYGAKLNLTLKKTPFHVRTFFDFMKGPSATIDAVVGQDGFVVGGEAGYDVQKAMITKYSAAIGYQSAKHSSSITATNNLSVFAAAYHHKVNSAIQAGAKATYDSKNNGAVGLEVASKYQLDPMSFMKGRVDDKGLAAVSYNAKINSNFTLGIGAAFDTQKLNEATHKLGMHFAFEG